MNHTHLFSFLLLLLHHLSFVHSAIATSTSTSTALPLQLLSLLSLKSAFHDPINTFNDWDATNPGHFPPLWCTWSGIKCSPKTSQIISLDLSGRNLSGKIPPQISYLTHLQRLNISGNSFGGPFQSAIFDLRYLQTLDINHNNFNSTFPPGISKLTYLVHFNAYSNSFAGPLPLEFARLRHLQYLNLGGSYFEGAIPASFGKCTRLKYLYLAGNLLTGQIPEQIGLLRQLEHLEIGYNLYSGGLPSAIGLLSNLFYLDISVSNLSDHLPLELGKLTKLDTLLLFKNHISGSIPASLGRMAALRILDLSDNKLSGVIPVEFSLLKQLNTLSLMDNNLTGDVPRGIGELPNLEILSLWNNSLTGALPQKLGLNSKLQKLDVSSNYLSGPIPPSLCLGNNLVKLILFANKFSGMLPSTLTKCTSLWRIRIQDNELNGSIPLGFGKLPNVTYMDMSKNKFTGPIPKDFGNAAKLEYLNISDNSFYAELPDNIWMAPSLQIFSASLSNLVGKLPEFKGCQSFYKIELARNELNGSIPWNIDHCEKLITLNLKSNSFTGIIPWEISTLPSITEVDLSRNNLTGTIPSSFGNSSTLEGFNVSYNQLTGPVPSFGTTFTSLHPSSFIGNEGLCGGLIAKPCNTDKVVELRPQQPKRTAGAIIWIMAAAFGICIFILIAIIRYFRSNCSHRFSNEDHGIGHWKLTAFQKLNFTAADIVESATVTGKIVGLGATGAVYKAEMPHGEIIAVKKLWGKQKEMIRRRRGVLAEVEVLGNVRHRNIVRLLGCCSNSECTMLLYEYMPNGSLDDLLHGSSKGDNTMSDWLTRYEIALGVAQGICYLHHDCDPVIVHRDLKPSNILLDGEMAARVADFGLAKLIEGDESMSVIAGSSGYIAPEYGYTLQVDEKSDIYSYGVVLLEILSGKRSVDTSEFGEGNSIVDWVRCKIKAKEGLKDILDKNVSASCVSVRDEMVLLLRVALLCTSRNPADRPSMRDVVSMLEEAKPKRKSPDDGGGDVVVAGGGKPLRQKPTC